MAQAQRARLANEHAVHVVGLDVVHDLEQLGLVATLEFVFELESRIKMITDGALVAARDEDHFPYACRVGFVDRVLDQRLVDHRQHLFGNGLGGGQETRAQTTHRKNSFLNFH